MGALFDSTTIGPMQLKNRLFRSATWENMADAKGHLTPQLSQVYTDLACGGVGSIITGYAFIREEEQPNPGMMGIYDDSFISEYQELTSQVHEHGANIIMQIAYGGSQTGFNTESRLIWGPSAVENALTKVTPTPMTREDIAAVVESFAQAARRVQLAGFDGVQLHGAHAYLLSQFLTPYYNRRTDEYGGSIENRARIIYEVLDAVRKTVGPDYPVFIKMHSTDDWGEQGLTPNDALIVARGLEERGITAIELSGGNTAGSPDLYPGRPRIIARDKQSYFQIPAAQIAQSISVPVILVGGNRSVEVMESILESTDIGYFSLARTLLSEPDLPNKWAEGYRGQPRCVACNQCRHEDFNQCILDRKQAEKEG